MNQVRNKQRATTPRYLELPVAVRAVSEGQPVVVGVGIGGCGCECDHQVVGIRAVRELTDFEPLTLWLAAVGREARRKQRRVELPLSVCCVSRADAPALVMLSGVRPDGVWLGYDEEARPVRARLPEVVVVEPTATYLGCL